MNIVKWNETIDVPVNLDESTKRGIFLKLLEGKIDKQWRGKIIRKDAVRYKQNAPLVQIRNSKGDAEILISVGVKKAPWTQIFNGTEPTEATVMMSQNGTAEYKIEDFAEINLAVLEAKAVYNALIEEVS